MNLLLLDWSFTLEMVARVAAWSVIVGFFFALGSGLRGFVYRDRRP